MSALDHSFLEGGGTGSPAVEGWSPDQPRPVRRPALHKTAFTFIEVMVALLIFALSGLVLASAYVNVLSAQHAALHRDDRAADLRLVREALRAEPSPDKVTAWNELTLPDDRSARWRAVLTPTTVADLFEVALEIELTDGDGKKSPTITETCRLLRPTWSQPADRETLRAAARSKLAERTYQ